MTTIPDTMRHIEIQGAGGPPDVLVETTGPVPLPGAGQVLVRVAAAGVNRPDVQQRKGGYPPPPGASPIPGLEIAGTIVAVGDGVAQDRLGAEVCALVTGGGYAEYCVADDPLCLPIPRGLDWVRAAAIPETFMTVWTNVFQRGGLQPGETLLVHGGSSGIGTTAIQLAKHFGATVITTVGTADKAEACRRLGADHVILYREQDFVAEVTRITDGAGVELILDMVGADYWSRNIECLKVEGRLVQIAFLSGPKVAEANMLPLMLKRLTYTGSTLRPRTVAQKRAIAEPLLEHVWPLLEAGTVGPVLHTTFPLGQAADAHRLMEGSTHIGKIMLSIEG